MNYLVSHVENRALHEWITKNAIKSETDRRAIVRLIDDITQIIKTQDGVFIKKSESERYKEWFDFAMRQVYSALEQVRR